MVPSEMSVATILISQIKTEFSEAFSSAMVKSVETRENKTSCEKMCCYQSE